jgi:hypothetical protein
MPSPFSFARHSSARPITRPAPHALRRAARATVESLDSRTLMASGPWSSPSTWANGQVPVAGQVVTIPAGDVVTLDTNTAALGGLVINGTLQASDTKDLSLTSRYVGVADGGTFRVGTELDPYDYKFTLTLTGVDQGANITVGHHTFGDKFLGVAGGTLDLHGASASKKSWTRLNAHANAGATSITLAETTGWAVGDTIVIAPSGTDARQAERRTITAISGNTYTLNATLSYDHWGALQTIAGQTVDQRATVALLTRNIVVQGDAQSYRTGSTDTSDYLAGFGGHVMAHHNSTTRIRGVEFYRMGQTGKQGRYSLHWHWAENSLGSYAKNNSIHDSLQRGIVTHQTSNVLVQDNVAYRVLNHIYIPAEDGTVGATGGTNPGYDESGNQYIGNWGGLAISPTHADQAFDDPNATRSFQSEDRSSIFWMRNPNNKLEGNVAAGTTHGSGYFYDGAPAYKANGTAFDRQFDFSNNVAHSNGGASGFHNPNYPPHTLGHGLLLLSTGQDADGSDHLFSGLNAFKNTNGGAWLEDPNHVLTNSVLADNATAIVTESKGEVRNTLIVGDSANNKGAAVIATEDFGTRAGLASPPGQGRGNKGFTFANTKIVDFPYPFIYINDNSRGHFAANIAFSGTTRTNAPKPYVNDRNMAYGYVADADGGFTGTAKASKIYSLRNAPSANWRYSKDAKAFYANDDGTDPGSTYGLRVGDYIAYDDMELGTFGTGTYKSGGFGWSADGTSNWTRSGSTSTAFASGAAYTGTQSLSIQGNSTVARPVNLSGVSSATLAFQLRPGVSGTGNNLKVEYYNGSSWVTLETYANVSSSTWQAKTIALPAAALTSSFQVRFNQTHSNYNARSFIDDVVITGVPAGGGGSLMMAQTPSGGSTSGGSFSNTSIAGDLFGAGNEDDVL